ncbi:MAG: c-type cytochrome [Bacteroidetes bacterium]|nr:c-type cytochrome [Bacteroidota bacterium]
MKLKARHTFFFLSVLFLAYSISIYMKPLSENEDARFNKKTAAEGRLVWQKYNCQACHQLYGLGGYLGPDLTNVYSHPKKGENLIKAMVKTGSKQMPAFNLSENEMQELVEFLKSTDASGTSDPRTFTQDNFGMIEGHEHK